MYEPSRDGPKTIDPGEHRASESHAQVHQPVQSDALGRMDSLRRRWQPTICMSTTARESSHIAWTTWKPSVSGVITRRTGIVNNITPRESRDAVKAACPVWGER